MIIYTTSTTEKDLLEILELQKANLAIGLDADEIKQQGFVTINHSYEALLKLNNIERHIIAKDNDKVIAYVLAMTKQSKFDIPVIVPMFEMFDSIQFANKPISDYNYIAVGQVCVDKKYRGQKIFDECYISYQNIYKDKYQFAVTEIASTNQRSLNAHKRIGFKEIHKYRTSDQTEWIIVLWNWGNAA